MSKQSGPIVFTATPEMAKTMKVFKAGATYVAHQASAVALAVGSPPTTRSSRTTKPAKTAKKKVSKKTAKKATKKTAKKVAKKTTKKVGKKATVKPGMIVKFVRKNEGCNMTDIEGHTNLPQAVLRRILNSARESGVIRTEGQRRGLRYFVGAPESADAGGAASD